MGINTPQDNMISICNNTTPSTMHSSNSNRRYTNSSNQHKQIFQSWEWERVEWPSWKITIKVNREGNNINNNNLRKFRRCLQCRAVCLECLPHRGCQCPVSRRQECRPPDCRTCHLCPEWQHCRRHHRCQRGENDEEYQN